MIWRRRKLPHDAQATLEAAATAVLEAHDEAGEVAVGFGHYRLLIDDLVERGAPHEVVEELCEAIGEARQWDLVSAPVLAAYDELALMFGRRDRLDTAIDQAARHRSQIARRILDLATWKEDR